ncbi:hypothetical protein HMPREF1570_4647 [Klebsiella oxytoca KA-2]|nr:hypothetical protein HMPREF1570_4647 [Klebsiella oxytoca KA-2]
MLTWLTLRRAEQSGAAIFGAGILRINLESTSQSDSTGRDRLAGTA